jgi:putative transposase
MTTTNIKLLADIIECFYCVRYATTTRSLSRYSKYSRRSLFRFLKADHEWIAMRIILLKSFIFKESKHFIAAIDEVVEGKSGKLSFGLSRFYSSIAQKPIASICFFGLSLIDVDKRCSYFLAAKQVVYTEEDKKRIAQQKNKRQEGKARAEKGQRLSTGRKKGSKNGSKQANNTASFRVFTSLWQESIGIVKKYLPAIKLTHLVADSAYSSVDYINLAQQKGLHLISRLASNAALYQLYQGSNRGRGRSKTYGNQWNLSGLESAYCKAIEQGKQHRYEFYQLQALSKSIKGITLNVVVLKTIQLNKKQESINVFFTTDLTLHYQTMIDYYSLRFQIEFDFRDAKQHFGLSDFKNYKEKNLTNFVNLSLLLCLVSKILLEDYRTKLAIKGFSILDLKIVFNSRNMARKLFKLTHNQADTIFNEQFCDQFIPDDLINAA